MGDIDFGKPLPLSGSLDRPRRWLLAILLIPAVGVVVGLVVALSRLPAQGRAALLFGAGIAPLIVVLAAMMTLRSLKRASVYVDQGELVINTGLGSKRIKLALLRRNGLRVVDLREHTELKPMLRLWGTGLPGFAGGWFRLRNGEKAVCLILDRERVSYLRCADDRLSILLSLRDPEALRTLLADPTAR